MINKNRKKTFILHIFPQGKFTDNYVLQINKYFGSENHIFYIYDTKEPILLTCIKEENVVFFDNPQQALGKSYLFKRAEKIFIHGGWTKLLLIFNRYHSDLIKKLYIVFWGGDLYNDIFPLKFRTIPVWLKKRKIIEQCGGIINLTEADYKELQKRYWIKNKHFVAKYISRDGRIDLENELVQYNARIERRNINILIGNSATASNNHAHIIDVMALVKQPTMRFYFPLSYGDPQYAKEVMKYAKIKLGEQCVFLTDFLEFKEYHNLLAQMDIGIFAAKRQQAMGNINTLLHMGVKVFVYYNSPLWKYYTKEIGCYVYDINKIKKCSAGELVHMPTRIRKYNIACMERVLKVENEILMWQKIFEA